MKRFFLIPLLICTLILVGCVKWASWHQKLTLYFDTPNGQIEASNVVGLRYQSAIKGLEILDTYNVGVTGEALMVDMGQGRYMFVLLDNIKTLFYHVADDVDLSDKRGYFEMIKVIKRQKTPLVIRPKRYPMLVTFDDVNDPKSVRQVDPADLAATFGEGYTLTRMTLQVTDEPVTEGVIEGVLGWLSEYPEPGLCKGKGEISNIPICSQIYHGDFIRRTSK